MPFIPTQDEAKVNIEGLWQAQKVLTNLWFKFGAGLPVSADLIALATDIWTRFDAALQTSHAANYSTTGVNAVAQYSETAPVGVYNPSAPRVGTGGSTSVPLNAAWSFTHRTLLRGRSYRGRSFLPGLTGSVLTDAGEGSLATLAGIASVFVGNLITTPPTGWEWGVVSHYLNHLARPQGVHTAIVATAVDTLLDSMRRRLKARGR